VCDQWAFPPIERRVRRCAREAQVEMICTEIRYSDGAAVSQEMRRVCAFAAFHLIQMRRIPSQLEGGYRARPTTYWECVIAPKGAS
jgi:hypothetical protein